MLKCFLLFILVGNAQCQVTTPTATTSTTTSATSTTSPTSTTSTSTSPTTTTSTGSTKTSTSTIFTGSTSSTASTTTNTKSTSTSTSTLLLQTTSTPKTTTTPQATTLLPTTTTAPTTTVPPLPGAHLYACLNTSKNWVLKDSWCYYNFWDSPLQSYAGETWWNAQGKCQSLTWRSSLAYPDSTSWNSYQSVRSYKNNNNQQLWLGCMYNSTKSKYYFTTGSQVSWTPNGGGSSNTPSGGNTYCYTDKNSYTWKTDSNSYSSRGYMCQMNAVPIIVQSELSLQVSATVIAVNSTLYFNVPSFWGVDVSTVYYSNYGDGTAWPTTSSSWSKQYAKAGFYTINIQVYNDVSGAFPLQATVTVLEYCQISSFSTPATVLGDPTNFTIALNYGTNCVVNIDFGDGTPVVNLGTFAFNISTCNVTNGCTTKGVLKIPISHTYTAIGAYKANATASNVASSTAITCTANVQTIIQGFGITFPTTFQYYPYQTNFVVGFAATNGSNFMFTIKIDSYNLTNQIWDANLRVGNVTVTPDSMDGIGVKNLSISVKNLVTPSVTVNYFCQIEYMFTNFIYNPNPANLIAGKPNTLQFTWSNASHFNYTIDYGKGAALISASYPSQIIDSTTQTWMQDSTFTYSAPGTYLVTVHVQNHVDSQTYTFNATVQYIVCCVTLVTDYVGILLSAGGAGVPGVFSLIWNDPTMPYPTDAVYDFDFGNQGGTLTGEPFLSQPNQTQTNIYTDYNTYLVTVTVHNKVSSLSLNTTIYIVVGFSNVQFDMLRLNPYVGTELHKYYLITGESAQFSVLMDQGSNYNLSIYWDCTNTPFTMYSTNSTPLYVNHSCPTAGQYNLSMHIQNIALQEWHYLPIPAPYKYLVVQDVIQGFQTDVTPSNALTILYASRATGVAATLKITTDPSYGATVGTNPRYIIDWDDSSLNTTGSISAYNPTNGNYETDVTHNYLVTGIYNVEITVWNEVSSWSYIEHIQVYDEVTGVNILPRYLDSTNREVPSHLPLPAGATYPTTVYFPMEYTVVLHANKLFGSYETYNWAFSDGYDAGTNSTIYRTFTSPGTYNVSLNIANQPTYGSTALTIIIEKSVGNVTITDNSPWPRYVAPYQQYTITLSTVPTDACYYFDFIDPSPLAQCRYLYMGNQATCAYFFPTFNPAVACPTFTPLASKDLEYQQANTSSNPIIYFTHKYNTLGRKTISLRIVNHVDDETFYYDSYVTKGWCQFPIVIVRDLNRCLTSDNCKCFQIPNNAANNYQCPQDDSSYTQGDRIGYQKDQLLLDADVSINCSSSQYIWFNWTLFTTAYNGSDIALATYLLNGTTFQSYSSKILVVPPQVLPGGRFHFTLTVSPSEEVDMDKSDDTYIYIQASNLVAEFYGNLSGTYVPQVPAQVFDAWTESYDPDLAKANKSGMTFDFYCRRTCESWPQPTSMQVYNDWRNYNYSACLGADGSYSPKGCFNTGNQAMPGPMPLNSTGSNGKWSFSPNAGTIVINTAAMVANQWYTLMVIVSKDSRMAYKEIMFYVSSSDVPTIYFQCVTNCQTSYSPLTGTFSGRYYQRVNPTSRFSIEAVIPDFSMATTYYYQWDLFTRPTDKGNNVFAPLQLPKVPDENWLYKASTGRSIRTMCIDADLWNNTFQYAGFYLRLSFWVDSNVTGPAGQYYFEFFLNEPPAQTGQCVPDMTPGVSLSPVYGIQCTGYQDLDAGDLFYFVKQMDPFTPNYWLDLGSSKTSMMLDNIVYVNAIAGFETNTFMTTIKVRIIDSSGSYIEEEFVAQVEPFDLDYASYGKPVWSILNYTANCDGCQLEDFFTLLAKQQRLANVTSATRTFATMLNENPSTGCIVTPCDNTTQNCTELELALTTETPDQIPSEIQVLIQKTLGTTWTSLSPCQLDLQLRIILREKMMGMFDNLQIPYFASFVQVLSALYTVTFVPQENTIQIMGLVQYCLQTGIENIDGTDPQMDIQLEADIREETCLSVTGIVANMEKTANYYGAIWRDQLVKYFPAFTMEGLIAEINAAETNSAVNSTDNTDDETENSMWTPGNDTFIDNDTMADLMVIRNNITLIHVILFNIQSLKNNITSYVQARKVMAEAPSILSTENLTAVYVKTSVRYMSSFSIAVSGGCNFVTGDATQMFGDLNQAEESIQAGGECSQNNPFVTDPSAKGLGGTVSLVFQNSEGVVPVGNLTKPIDAFVPRQLDFSGITPTSKNLTQPFSDSLFVYLFQIAARQAVSLMLYEGYIDTLTDVGGNYTLNGTLENDTMTTVAPTTKGGSNDTDTDTVEPIKETQFVIFIKYWKNFGADNLYDDYCIVPKWPQDSVNLTANPTIGDPRTCTITFTTAMAKLPTDMTTTGDAANVYVTVQVIPDGYTIDSFAKTTKIASFDASKYVQAEYTLFSIYSNCKYYDNDLKVWKDDGTQVGPNTTLTLTHCQVTHLTSFASGFSLPMNNLNLQDSGFLHLAENPIAFVFCLCIMCLYLILLVWCRKKDKEDVMKAGIAPLPDNDPLDRYLYQIVFYTGSRPNAGTSSKIFFQLTGEEGETEVRLAEDSHRMAFRRNGIDTFIMAVPENLGKLTYLRIWHDNSGPNPNWYFSRLQLLNVQTGEQFFFVVDNWLAIDEGDGQVERVVPVAGKGDLIEFNQLFFQKSQKALFDGHIWFSVFRRPPRSHFTRVQRLTCCLSLIYCTMIANILFYGQDTKSGSVLISVGPVTVSWNTMKVAIVSGLIVIPVNTALVMIFRYVKPRPAKSPMKEYEEQVKYQEKRFKKEEKKRLKQLKMEQSAKAKAPIDVNLVHTEVDENEEVESTKPEEPEKPEPPSVIHIDTRAKKKKFQLPHWFIYVGYVLAFCTVALGFWLIVQVAFGFGRAKALEWVVAMFISLIQSIIFVQPIKIICMAIVYACLCRKPEKDEYEPTEIELREDEVYMHEMQTANDMSNHEKRRQIQMQLRRTRNALPPEMQVLQNAREQRKKELAMYALLKEIFFYALFLYTLMMVAYGERDQLAYFMVRNSENIFLGTPFTSPAVNDSFININTPNDFYNWVENKFLPALYPQTNYINNPLPSSNRYMLDDKGFLAGTARFRQLRVKQNSCKVPKQFSQVINHCRDAYSYMDEDTEPYHKQWKPLDPNVTNDEPDDNWTWKSMSITKSNPFIGQISSYWGGGYIADLGYSADTAYAVFNDLQANGWVDSATRAIFVELALFYPSVNMFVISRVLVEFMSTGGAVTTPEFAALRLDPYDGPNAVPIIIGDVCCLLFLLWFLYRESKKLIKEKKKYFLEFWNWLEIIVIALMITALVMYAYRMLIRKSTLNFYEADPANHDVFNNFTSPLFWEELYSWMIYIVLFIANIKFLRILRFNRRISVIIDTMRYGWKYMVAFTSTLLIVFFAYALTAYLLFSTQVLDFMDFLSTIEVLWVIMLNVFNYSEFSDTNRVLGPIFFVTFTLILNFIMVNMFLSIVNDSFAVVKHDDTKQNEYELIDFVWFKLKRSLGFASVQVEHADGPMYAESQDTLERDLIDCNDKIEQMVIRLQDMFKEEKLEQKLKADWRFNAITEETGGVKRHIVMSE